jgi:hypothetical protein
VTSHNSTSPPQPVAVDSLTTQERLLLNTVGRIVNEQVKSLRSEFGEQLTRLSQEVCKLAEPAVVHNNVQTPTVQVTNQVDVPSVEVINEAAPPQELTMDLTPLSTLLQKMLDAQSQAAAQMVQSVTQMVEFQSDFLRQMREAQSQVLQAVADQPITISPQINVPQQRPPVVESPTVHVTPTIEASLAVPERPKRHLVIHPPGADGTTLVEEK